MPSSQHNNWWRLHVSALLQEFMKSNVRTSIRFKALAVMGVVNSHAGGFGYCTEMSSAEVASEIGVPGSSISNTLRLLDDLNVIRRDPAEGRGGRLVITPLGPEYWLLPNGGRFRPSKTNGMGFGEEKSSFVHQKEPGFHDNIKESIDSNNEPKLTLGQIEKKYEKVFSKLLSIIEINSGDLSREPSKLFSVMGVILLHSKDVNYPCELHADEIGKKLKHSRHVMVSLLSRLEELGFIKREYEGHKKRITPILPDPYPELTPVVSSDAPKEMSK